MAKTDMQYIKVTQVKSVIGRLEPQKRTAKALGLRRVNDFSVVPDNDAVRGMVNAISHLVKVEPAEAPAKKVKMVKREVAAGEIASSPKPKAPRNDGTTRTREEKVVAKPAAAKKPAVKKPAAKKSPAKKVAGEVASSPKPKAPRNDGTTRTKAKATLKVKESK